MEKWARNEHQTTRSVGRKGREITKKGEKIDEREKAACLPLATATRGNERAEIID